MRTHTWRLLTTASIITAGLAFTSAASAQGAVADPEADANSEDIVVTGSHIQRPDLEVASPVAVINAEEISLKQVNSAEDLLHDLPSVRPSIGPAVNNGSDGSASVDLRGIGSNRTLVLLNSRRIVPFGLDGVTDLNVVPVALIDRVDVVTGGASSTYGADAVAGVVNFVTKRNFSGADLSANYRISDRGDAKQYQVTLTVGGNFADDRGNIVFSAGYLDRSPLLMTERSFAAVPLSSANGRYSASTVGLQSIFTLPTNAALGLPASNFGAIIDQSTGLLRAAGVEDTYNSNIDTFFVTGLKRVNLYSSARYELGEGVELYASGLFNRNEQRIQQASSGTFANTYFMPLSNAYLPQGVRGQLCQATGLSVAACAAAAVAPVGSAAYREIPIIAQRRFVEFGPRINQYNSDVYQIQAGLRGEFTPSLRFDLSAQYGETHQTQTKFNWGSSSKVQQALRSAVNSAGQKICTDTSNGCVPFDLFGPFGSISPEQLAFIDLDAVINRKITQTVVTGALDGDLFGLTSPFADTPIAFSLGAEYRRLTAEAHPDAASSIQGEVLGTGARTPEDYGAYDVKEIFAELIAPLVVERPFFHRLQLEAGIRYSNYSTTGGSTTWKAGATYEPVRGARLRGMYQVAVRSPNIQELYQSAVTQLGNLQIDPCQASALPASAAGSQLAALCVATGAPVSSIGSIPAPTATQINNLTSGNRNLKTETAKTYTLGAVLTPQMLPGLSVTIDYFNITVRDAITKPSSGDIINGCYSTALNPNFTYNAFCELIQRNPLTGSLNGGAETPGVILAGSNLGRIETAGIDFTAAYRLDLGMLGFDGDPGNLTLGFNGTWLDYYHFQATPNAINRDCTGYYSNNCGVPRAKFRWNARATYQRDAFTASLAWNHIGSADIEAFNPVALTPRSTPQAGGPNPSTILADYQHIDSYDTFDLSLRQRFGDRLELGLLVENLFDRQPPIIGNTIAGSASNAGNTFPTVYDIVGRSFLASIRITY